MDGQLPNRLSRALLYRTYSVGKICMAGFEHQPPRQTPRSASKQTASAKTVVGIVCQVARALLRQTRRLTP